MASVLIVEDDRLIVRMLDMYLRGAGIDVAVAYTATEGWNALGSADPPLVALVDLGLPDFSGEELCQRVRARGEDLPSVYLILTTGQFTQREAADGIATAADEHIAKPFRIEQVIARVRHGMQVASQRRAAHTA